MQKNVFLCNLSQWNLWTMPWIKWTSLVKNECSKETIEFNETNVLNKWMIVKPNVHAMTWPKCNNETWTNLPQVHLDTLWNQWMKLGPMMIKGINGWNYLDQMRSMTIYSEIWL